MVQWGALREGGEKGIFISPARRIGLSERPAELVVQGVLVSHGHGMGLAQAIRVPVQVILTRLQLSQKLWVKGVMKPSRLPASRTATYRAGPPVW